jgi:hypothetical protein
MSEDESRSNDLVDIFFLHGHSSKEYMIKLFPTYLSINLQTKQNDDQTTLNNNLQLIPIDDIYGCICMKAYQNPIQCHLSLYLYSLKQAKGISGTFSKKENLHRSQKIFTYGKFDNFQNNFGEITRWHRGITYAIYLNRNLPGK